LTTLDRLATTIGLAGRIDWLQEQVAAQADCGTVAVP
jgi:hypothetical protein